MNTAWQQRDPVCPYPRDTGFFSCGLHATYTRLRCREFCGDGPPSTRSPIDTFQRDAFGAMRQASLDPRFQSYFLTAEGVFFDASQIPVN
jgi:hypothetical protein